MPIAIDCILIDVAVPQLTTSPEVKNDIPTVRSHPGNRDAGHERWLETLRHLPPAH